MRCTAVLTSGKSSPRCMAVDSARLLRRGALAKRVLDRRGSARIILFIPTVRAMRDPVATATRTRSGTTRARRCASCSRASSRSTASGMLSRSNRRAGQISRSGAAAPIRRRPTLRILHLCGVSLAWKPRQSRRTTSTPSTCWWRMPWGRATSIISPTTSISSSRASREVHFLSPPFHLCIQPHSALHAPRLGAGRGLHCTPHLALPPRWHARHPRTPPPLLRCPRRLVA